MELKAIFTYVVCLQKKKPYHIYIAARGVMEGRHTQTPFVHFSNTKQCLFNFLSLFTHLSLCYLKKLESKTCCVQRIRPTAAHHTAPSTKLAGTLSPSILCHQITHIYFFQTKVNNVLYRLLASILRQHALVSNGVNSTKQSVKWFCFVVSLHKIIS